jgi:uncharacterized membrane protein
MPPDFRHPVNRELAVGPLGARVADRVTEFMGSWAFIAIQTVIVVAWIGTNVYHLLNLTFDPFPFILLNLAFSTQAAYAAPLILLAGNRAALRDRMTLEHAATQSDIDERQNEQLLRGDTEILTHVEGLDERILQLEQRIIAAIEARGRD